MTTRAQVEKALDNAPHRDGLLVVDLDPDLRLLAHRPALPGGGAAIVVLGGALKYPPPVLPTTPSASRLAPSAAKAEAPADEESAPAFAFYPSDLS